MKSFSLLRALVLLIFFALACQPAFAIKRSDVIARAQNWADVPVPYSQTSYYLGYRQDCSGYVSYCWATTDSKGNPVSYNTNSLMSITSSINQTDLKQGDILVNTAGGDTSSEFAHTVIFDHWDDSSHTNYWVYEQGPDKTYYHKIPFPYWSNYNPSGYVPRRYQGIEEDGTSTDIWVNNTHGSGGDGSQGNPFNTVKAAVDKADATQSVTIHITPGVYNEKISTSKHIHFVTNGSGTVRIGG